MAEMNERMLYEMYLRGFIATALKDKDANPIVTPDANTTEFLLAFAMGCGDAMDCEECFPRSRSDMMYDFRKWLIGSVG